MLLIIESLSHFLIWCFYICSDVMSFESLITHEEWLTHLFLTFITCHVDLLMSWLLVVIKTFIELDEFIELTKFIEFKKFQKKILSDCFLTFQNIWSICFKKFLLIALFVVFTWDMSIFKVHDYHCSLHIIFYLLTQHTLQCNVYLHIWSSTLYFCKI